MEKICVIFGAGEVYTPTRRFDGALVIAADGGYAAAVREGFAPDAVIGDFDSGDMPEDSPAYVVKLDRNKDDTDMLAAVRLGLRRGCRTFVLYGGTGGRPDHTFANYAVLRFLNDYDARGYLIDRDTVATVMTEDKLVLPKTACGTVSVFPFGGTAEGIAYKNLKFTPEGDKLDPYYPLGVSNYTNGGAEISVKHGSLLVFFPREKTDKTK